MKIILPDRPATPARVKTPPRTIARLTVQPDTAQLIKRIARYEGKLLDTTVRDMAAAYARENGWKVAGQP